MMNMFILQSEEQNTKLDFVFCPSEAKRVNTPAAWQRVRKVLDLSDISQLAAKGIYI